MKRFIAILDFLAFILFGIIFAIGAFLILISYSGFKKKRNRSGKINRFTFAIFDLTSETYPSMREEALSDEYLFMEHSLYLDFNNNVNKSKNINGRIFFYSVAAHPDTGLYKAGFRKINMLLTELKVLIKAFSIVYRNNISFINAHDPHILGLNGLFIARLFRLPCILHLNSDFDMKYQGTGKISSPIFVSRGVERLFESVVIRSYDLIIADRNFYRKSRSFPNNCVKKYRAVGVRADRRHYSSLNSRRNLKGILGLDESKVLLYVGRLHPVKYPQDAIKAFVRIKKEIKDTAFLVIGTGVLKKSLEELVKINGLENSVSFLGSKSQEELIDIFHTADVLLAPHGGLTLVESALASTPIIAYDFDWHSEFLENGKMGYIVPFRDVDSMAQKAIEILTNEALRQKMSSYCREIAVSKCSRDRSLENEKKVYEELMRI